MNPAVKYGTALVLAHLMVNIIHGAAHRELGVELGAAAMLFVIGVILLSPLFAMVLLWASQKRLGLVILTLSMAASLVFGLYNHFAVRGPDHVGEQAPVHGGPHLSSRRTCCLSPKPLELIWPLFSVPDDEGIKDGWMSASILPI